VRVDQSTPNIQMAAAQQAKASLREGFAFRSGRLAPSAAHDQFTGSIQLCFVH